MMLVPALQEIAHQPGDATPSREAGQDDTFRIQTPGGVFHVRYDTAGEVSHLGGMVPFAQFLSTSRLFDAWIEEAPLEYTSNRAHSVRDVLGTQVLALINGHYRFSHISALRGDQVVPSLLGMERVASEDSVRRGLIKMVRDVVNRTRSASWIRRHLFKTLETLMLMKWTLDIDVTVKPTYGYQPGSVVGYNPQKPGRPSHALHSFVMANTRLVLDVAVHPGNEHTSNHTLIELKRLLDTIPRGQWPSLLRGDCGFGNDEMMTWAETVNLPYLFKLRMTKKTKHLVKELDLKDGWVDTGQGWEAKESKIQLSTWDIERRVVVLRRPDPGPRYPRAKDLAEQNKSQADMMLAGTKNQKPDNQQTPKQEILDVAQPYIVAGFEYQVLVTTLTEDLPTLAQRYRDRADAENVFDEIKNHWGWGGFTSRTFEVTQLVALFGALVYNWWSIFCRLADQDHHREAVTTRPAYLHGVVLQTTHANQRTLTITSTNGEKSRIASFFARASLWLERWRLIAEQWTDTQRWGAMLKHIFAGPMGAITVPTG